MASTPMQDVQDVVLSTTEKGQQLALEAIRTWVDTVQAFTPKVPSVQIPFADRLPKADDVVANTYDFIEQILASQRKFAEEVVKTTSPLLPSEKKAPAAK